MRMVLNIKELIGPEFSSSLEDAVRVYKTILPFLKNNTPLGIDTTGCSVSVLFLREAFCRVYAFLPEKTAKRLLCFKDRNLVNQFKVRREIRRSFRYYARLHPEISGRIPL